ncbi:BTB/POZ domain-containing protein 2-like [Rhopilema esculentum]|uniref:BTB/POZ domain-containing protein 2-like n=1 Tax=Rhopilema esculentum TaxID=499914 RepID=UPI0031E1CF14|eukprot:gene14710-5808_t
MFRQSGQAGSYNSINDFYSDWQATKLKIKDRVTHLYNNELMSDVVFIVKDDNKLSPSRVPAHKFVLAASSSVFFAMFYGPMAQADKEIEIVDCENANCLLELFRFIYTDDVELNWENSFNILYLSKKYMIPLLRNRCCEFLEKTITKENVLAVLQQSLKLGEKGLSKKCIEFIQPLISELAKMESFLDLDVNTLEIILKEDVLHVAEIDLFLAVLKWCKSEALRREMAEGPESWKEVLGDAIYLIRFPCMTSQEFATHCIFSGLLTLNQIRDLSYVTSLPDGIHPVDIIERIPFAFNKRIMSLNRLCQGKTVETWNYGDSPDALDFTVTKEVCICGISLFGEPALQSLEVSIKTGKEIVKPEISAGLPDSGPTEGSYRVMFSQPVRILPFKVHTLVVLIKGPDSKGANYKRSSWCHDVKFNFKSSDESRTGTSATYGQFPEFLFTIIS